MCTSLVWVLSLVSHCQSVEVLLRFFNGKFASFCLLPFPASFAGANQLCSKKPMIISFKWRYLVCKESSFNLPKCLFHPPILSSSIILTDKSMTDALKSRLMLYIVHICSVILSKLLRRCMSFTHLQKMCSGLSVENMIHSLQRNCDNFVHFHVFC